jgi:hypothetical protein
MTGGDATREVLMGAGYSAEIDALAKAVGVRRIGRPD